MEGRKFWYVVGAYMKPIDQPEVHWVDHPLECGPAGVETLLARDLNACLAQPRGQQGETLETTIANYGLVDQAINFIPRRR